MQIKATWDNKRFGGDYYQAVRVELVDDSGIHTAKYVDAGQFLNALNGAGVKEDNLCRIGKLPQHYYDGAIKRDAEMAISGKVQLIIPPAKTVVQFENTRYEIPFPALLFFYSIQKGKVTNTEIYALKGGQWNEKSVLYNYPYGNVNPCSHSVCWGTNVLPEVTDLQKLDVVCSMFYTSPCNNDLYMAGKSTVWKIENLRNVFEQLKKRQDFPDEILVNSGKGTVGSLWRNFLE